MALRAGDTSFSPWDQFAIRHNFGSNTCNNIHNETKSARGRRQKESKKTPQRKTKKKKDIIKTLIQTNWAATGLAFHDAKAFADHITRKLFASDFKTSTFFLLAPVTTKAASSPTTYEKANTTCG